MSKKQDMSKMFDEMGLGNEEERQKFKKMANLDKDSNFRERRIFIRLTSSTSIEGETEDAKLA
jgi:hypothetical protein